MIAADATPIADQPTQRAGWSAIDQDVEQKWERRFQRKPTLKQFLLVWLTEYNRY